MGCGASGAVPAHEPGGDPAAQLQSFILWGARDLTKGDAVSRSDPYCVARVGPKGSAWAAKPRGGGRRSEPLKDTSSPEWRMGFTVDLRGIQEPEVHVRVYDKDYASEDDFLGEALVPLAELGEERKELALSGRGEPRGFISLSSGAVGFLAKNEIKHSSFYEELAPMGSVKPVKLEDISGDGPFRIGGERLPEALRGLFWLMDQGQSSALASFGGPSNDGGGCCTGQITGNKILVRVGGDRVWSMADSNLTSWKAVEAADLIYHFVFNDAQNPTRCQIYPEAGNLDFTFTAEWLLDFEMELTQDNRDFPGSVVWKRLSYVGGASVKPYDLVQVMDQNGKRIEPAWSKFAEYMNSKATGGTPGTIYYREIPSS